MSRAIFTALLRGGGPPPRVSAEREARIEKRREELTRPLPALSKADCRTKLQKTNVAVVGGGLAGLLAAKLLGQNGVKVSLFEANKEVGGRVRSNTSFSDGRITEEGAELIGSMHTTWLALARELGIGLISRMDAESYARVGLNVKLQLDKLITWPELIQLAIDVRDKILIPIGRDASKIVDASQPWAQKADAALIGDWNRMSVADKLTLPRKPSGGKQPGLEIPKSSRLFLAMELLLRNNNVAPLEKLNYLGLLCLVKGNRLVDRLGQHVEDDNLLGYWTELEIFRCADGCQAMATRLAKNAKASITRKAMVNAIDLDKRTLEWVPVAGGKAGGKATSESFDYVILAIPPNLWPKINIRPHHPKDTIGLMATGAAAKFFSNVGERFWIGQGAAPLGGSPAIGHIWEGTDNQTQSGTQGIVLSVFTGTKIPPESDYRKELERLYPGYAKRLLSSPGKATKLVDWSKEPFVETGYASPAIGQILTIGKELAQPFLGRLFFAGEHTQMDGFGYMEGALRSGERAANAILKKACELPVEMVAEAESPFADEEYESISDASLEELYASVLNEP